jgi:hypothetical protein
VFLNTGAPKAVMKCSTLCQKGQKGGNWRTLEYYYVITRAMSEMAPPKRVSDPGLGYVDPKWTLHLPASANGKYLAERDTEKLIMYARRPKPRLITNSYLLCNTLLTAR